jgi:dihydrofolate reductase
MRKLFSFNLASLDGFFEGPDHEIDWHNVDEEFNDFAVEQTSSVDMIIFGRKTYQLMESYWPTPSAIADDPAVADLMNSLPKIVFSRTLDQANWNNTRLIKDNAADELMKIKQQPGKDLAIFGSANLISSLMDVIDEHRVMINPVLLRRGNPLFKDTGDPIKLSLVNVRTFNSGNILLTYELIGK